MKYEEFKHNAQLIKSVHEPTIRKIYDEIVRNMVNKQ